MKTFEEKIKEFCEEIKYNINYKLFIEEKLRSNEKNIISIKKTYENKIFKGQLDEAELERYKREINSSREKIGYLYDEYVEIREEIYKDIEKFIIRVRDEREDIKVEDRFKLIFDDEYFDLEREAYKLFDYIYGSVKNGGKIKKIQKEQI